MPPWAAAVGALTLAGPHGASLAGFRSGVGGGHFPSVDLCARQNWRPRSPLLLDMVQACFLPFGSSPGNSRRQNARCGVRAGFQARPHPRATGRTVNTSESCSLTAEKAGSPTSRCQQTWIFPGGSAQRETLSPPLSW